MKIATQPFARTVNAAGFTLIEMMVAGALTTFLMASVITLGMYTSKSFCMMGNYVDLDSQSRNAVDILGREIRDASALVAFSTNNPAYLQFTNATTGQSITVTYNEYNSTLTLARTGQPTRTLLTGCDSWSFSLYDRSPDITATNITFYSSTNILGQLDPTFCKVVNMTWVCSRKILGSPFNTESVQTAQIVLRNQVNY